MWSIKQEKRRRRRSWKYNDSTRLSVCACVCVSEKESARLLRLTQRGKEGEPASPAVAATQVIHPNNNSSNNNSSSGSYAHRDTVGSHTCGPWFTYICICVSMCLCVCVWMWFEVKNKKEQAQRAYKIIILKSNQQLKRATLRERSKQKERGQQLWERAARERAASESQTWNRDWQRDWDYAAIRLITVHKTKLTLKKQSKHAERKLGL